MDAGYIVRSEDQHDRRTVYFSITEKGTATLKEVEMLGQDYYATIYSVLSEEELHQYIRIQRKLLFHIKISSLFKCSIICLKDDRTFFVNEIHFYTN